MKNSNIIIRVSEEEKNNLNEIISLLGEKNVSSFIRNIINDLSSSMLHNGQTDLSQLIKKYENERDSLIGQLNAFELMKFNQKINILKSINDEIK